MYSAGEEIRRPIVVPPGYFEPTFHRTCQIELQRQWGTKFASLRPRVGHSGLFLKML